MSDADAFADAYSDTYTLTDAERHALADAIAESFGYAERATYADAFNPAASDPYPELDPTADRDGGRNRGCR